MPGGVGVKTLKPSGKGINLFRSSSMPALLLQASIEAAHAAGIACVAVGSGHFTVDQLREAGADYAIASLEAGLPLSMIDR